MNVALVGRNADKLRDVDKTIREYINRREMFFL